MVVQWFFAGLFVSLCVATKIHYPADNPCVLIDVETNNSLTWTHENGTEMAIPNWNLANISVIDGNCTADVRYVKIIFHVDNATMQFNFQNTSSGKVDVNIALDFVPEVVFTKFNNTYNSSVEVNTSLMTGGADKAFKCDSQTVALGNQMVGKDDYKLTLRMKNLMIQGFGVTNGTFSKDIDECPADKPTTAPPHNTTVTTAPLTTPAPKSPPKVTLNATDGNETCAMLVGEMTLSIKYNTTKNGMGTANVFIPESVKTTGKCMNENKTDILMAKFGNGWGMDIVFKGDGDNIWWDMLTLTVVYDKNHFPGIDNKTAGTTKNYTKSFSKAFKAKKDGSYLCNSDTTTEITADIMLKTTNFQYTALQQNVTSFSDKNIAECSSDAKTSSIVPIAVGAALAGLVVIVLIAYLIGRRRNRKGYESV